MKTPGPSTVSAFNRYPSGEVLADSAALNWRWTSPGRQEIGVIQIHLAVDVFLAAAWRGQTDLVQLAGSTLGAWGISYPRAR